MDRMTLAWPVGKEVFLYSTPLGVLKATLCPSAIVLMSVCFLRLLSAFVED